MQNISALWVDAAGNQVIHLAHLTDAAILTDLVAGISSASNADWSEYWGSPAVTQTPAPTVATYLSASPAALLLFTCADGTLAQARVPSPKTALFLADGETVDPADPTGVIAALLAILASASGSAATAFAGGVLESSKRR